MKSSFESFVIQSVIAIVLGTVFLFMLLIKLFELVDWSWWIVTCPISIPISIYILGIIVGSIYSKLKK